MFLQQPIFKTNGYEPVFLLVVMFINIDLIPIILLDYTSVTLCFLCVFLIKLANVNRKKNVVRILKFLLVTLALKVIGSVCT